MSENKHTPGPWQVEFAHTQQSSGIVYWQVHDGSDAIACNQFCAAGNAEANARLIAAAPDLLGALKEILESPESQENSYDCFQGLKDLARAAIAKAEGRS